MFKFTLRRKELATEILDLYTQQLHDNRRIDVVGFEHELRDLWKIGYQELKDILIDMMFNHSEYTHLAAYYMEHSNGQAAVVSEFKRPLAKLYGMPRFAYGGELDETRRAYWESAFAVISRFDIESETGNSSIIQVSSWLKEKIMAHLLSNPTDLRLMSPRRFEELIAEILDSFGYRVELTQATRDGGRDIIAIGSNSVASSKYLVECKRYQESNKVGVSVVRSLHGVVVDERATKGIVVTTSSFSADAIAFMERNQWTLEGRAYDGVVEWLKQYQKIKFPNS